MTTCTAEEAAARIAEGALLIDVREPEEHAKASVARAILVPGGLIEFKIAELCAEPEREILIHCASGGHAVLAARAVGEMAYRRVRAVAAFFADLAAACD